MSFIANTLISATVGLVLITSTVTMTQDHAANAEQVGATIEASCSAPLQSAALALTAGTGDGGAAFDEANASCTKLGAGLAPALDSFTVNDEEVLAATSPEVRAQVERLMAQLDELEVAHLSTLDTQAQVEYLFTLAGGAE